MGRSCFTLVCILCFMSLQPHLLEAALQLSLNCGGPTFNDTSTIPWLSDEPYLASNAGTFSAQVSNPATVSDQTFRTLRYFPPASYSPNKKKNKYCYTLPDLGANNLYLIRVGFFYGNYDAQNSPPSFALLLNYDVWIPNVNTTSDQPLTFETIYVSNDNVAYVCLAPNASSDGTPFISSLQLSLLDRNNGMYDRQNVSGGLGQGYALNLYRRINYGAESNDSIRYPVDEYDRIWEANTTTPSERLRENVEISEASTDDNAPPDAVMETAITGESVDGMLEIEVYGRSAGEIGKSGVYIIFHFAELSLELTRYLIIQTIAGQNADLTVGYTNAGFVQEDHIDQKLGSVPDPITASIIQAVTNNSGPPFLNALEVLTWSLQPLRTNATFPSDVSALVNIQRVLGLTSDGDGDPCLPLGYGWSWVTCNTNFLDLRIIEINLTNFNLQGAIPGFINNLTELQKIYLADNRLNGSIPDFSALQNLQVLDLRNNLLSGPIPSSLPALPHLNQVYLDRNSDLCGPTPSLFQQKNVNVTYSNTSLCETGSCACPTTRTNSSNLSSRTKYIIVISALVTFNVVSIIGILLFCKLRRRKLYQKTKLEVYKALVKDTNEIFPIQYLTYEEIKDATNQFSNKIGEGGFGDVFRGTLQNGRDVAIKLLTDASRQGLKEFNSEVAVLSNVHHKNLVTLVGYSTEKSYTLVYEYIPMGNLRDNLYGDDFRGKTLSWETRLSIAIDTAIGLEYLHVGCEPSIIHRDVKSSNILLTEKLQAKVADFGLSRLRKVDSTKSHVSTLKVVGTVGYLDPEYSNTNQFTDKSDVYSFGVVLFELICGRPPIDSFSEPPHIISWVMPSITNDRVEDIVDPKLIGGYKSESIKVVVDVALKCVNLERNSRPNISEVIQGLREAQRIENEFKSSKQVISTDDNLLEAKVDSKDVSMGSTTSDQPNIEIEARNISIGR